MADIVGYIEVEGAQRKLILRSADGSVDCKCRFKHIAPVIDFSYQSLVDALNEAIDKEAAETNNQFVTTERVAAPAVVEYNYDALMEEFGNLAGALMTKDQSNAPKITAVVDRYLGRGKKVSDATPDQAEFIHLIIGDLKAELM